MNKIQVRLDAAQSPPAVRGIIAAWASFSEALASIDQATPLAPAKRRLLALCVEYGRPQSEQRRDQLYQAIHSEFGVQREGDAGVDAAMAWRRLNNAAADAPPGARAEAVTALFLCVLTRHCERVVG